VLWQGLQDSNVHNNLSLPYNFSIDLRIICYVKLPRLPWIFLAPATHDSDWSPMQVIEQCWKRRHQRYDLNLLTLPRTDTPIEQRLTNTDFASHLEFHITA
jgi:hypothetical protein